MHECDELGLIGEHVEDKLVLERTSANGARLEFGEICVMLVKNAECLVQGTGRVVGRQDDRGFVRRRDRFGVRADDEKAGDIVRFVLDILREDSHPMKRRSSARGDSGTTQELFGSDLGNCACGVGMFADGGMWQTLGDEFPTLIDGGRVRDDLGDVAHSHAWWRDELLMDMQLYLADDREVVLE